MDSGRNAIPYVPFKTFLSAIDGLERGLPNQFDRSLWPSYSGAIQGQLLGALRFFGLMDENNRPTAGIRELLRHDQRRPALRRLIEDRYAALVSLDLTGASPKQLDEAMRTYGLTGATHRKAMSFFLQAATYAGLNLSVLLKSRTRTGGAHRRAAPPAPDAVKPAAAAAPAFSRTIELRSGGSVTITATVDLFALTGEDRAFVFEIADRLREYGAQSSKP